MSEHLPETVRMLRWTSTPPTDTGRYWFRAKGVVPTIARCFFSGRNFDQGASVHTGGQSALWVELETFEMGGAVVKESIREEVARLANREGAQWSDGRVMPPETRE
jgi:hypothetical protein